MGSVDIPPFLREKMKQKVQQQKNDADVPPFLKKKELDGTGESTNISQPTPSNSEAQLPSQSGNAPRNKPVYGNPLEVPSATITTNDGASFNIPNAPMLGLTDDVVKGMQQRVSSKTVTPTDIQIISKATNKPQKAIEAYITQNKFLGSAVEQQDKQANDITALIQGVGTVNKMLGLKFDANDILSSAEKTSTYLNGVKNILQKDIQRRKEAQAQKYAEQPTAFSEDFAPTRIELSDNEKDFSSDMIKQIDEYTSRLTNHVVNKTVEEDLQNNVPREKTISKIFERIDLTGFKNNIKASIANIPNPIGNPMQGLGNAYDYLTGNKEKENELLNSQKGIAEQYYNNSLQNLGLEKKSQGVINNNPDLVKQGDEILNKVDYNVTDKYPSLVKQEMVRRVNEAIARESGVVEGEETRNIKEHIFGADVIDYARHLKNMGYLDNPKTKDLALNLLQHPSLFADNSIMGSMGNSFLQPFKDLGMSVGDITQFRNAKDVYSDKIKDELFPKDFSGNASDNPLQLKTGVKIGRTILNTTANLAGMMAIATVTEGLGTGVGLSTTTSRALGAYTSFGLLSFDASLKDSKNFIDNEAAQYLYATINAVANAEGGRLLDLGKITRLPNGLSEDFAKLAKGISEKTIEKAAATELLDKTVVPKYIEFAMKYGKNVGKGAATMAAFNIKDNILRVGFGDPNTKEEDILPQAGHAFIDGVLGMSILGGFGAAADLRNEKNTTYKGTIYNMALNHDATKDILDIGLKNNEYTKAEYDSKVQILNTARVAKKSVDAAENETGINLTQEQKAVYVANKTAQGVLRKQAEQDGIPEETANKYLAQSKRLGEQSTQILDGLKFTPTLEPLYDLFNAEKTFNEAQEKLNPADKKSEDEFLAAKDNYDKLYTEYLKGNSDKPIVEEPSSNIDEGKAQNPLQKGVGDEPTPNLEAKDTEIIPTFEKVKSFIPEEKLDETQNVITKVNNADNINVDDLNKAENNLYTALDKAPEAAHLIEPLILKLQNYPDEFKTKTEVSTVTEKVPVEGSFAAKSKQEIKPALERSAGSDVTITNPDGGTVKGKLDIKSGQYVVDVPQGTQRVIGEKAITDNGLFLPTVEEMENPVEFDKDGNVSAATVKTKNGNLITIHNPETALDIAIQLHSDMVGEIPDAAFEKAYQEVQKEIKTEVPLTENISSPKTDTNEKSNAQKDNSKSNNEADGQSGKENDQKNVLGNEGAGTTTAPLNEGGEPPNPPETKTGDSENDGIGITHADTKDIRIEQGLGEYDKTPETVEQWNQQANERIEKGELPALIKRLENGGGVVDGTEQTMLGKYIAAVNEKASKYPSNENLAELKKALLINEVVGTQQFGQVGRARQETFMPEETVAKWMLDKAESLGVDELTEEQKTDVSKKFADYEAALKIESEKRVQAEDEISKLKAELALKTEFEKRKTIRSKNTQSLKDERQEIITSIKDKLKKARGETNVTVVPYAKELYAIAPDVAKLVRNLVEEGAVKLEDIVDTVYTNLKDEIADGITKKDVNDLIAGEYNENKKTKSELEQRLKDIKDEAALLNKLEALENGEPPKEPKKLIERNKRIKELREKIKDFKKENPDPVAQVRALKNKNEKEFAQIVKDLANKNFETKKQTPIDYQAALKRVDPKLWKETMDAISKRDEAKHLWELEKQRDELKKRGLGKKILDAGSKLISTSKAIKAGIDDSVTGIQLGMAIMANPRAGVKAKWQAILDTNAKRFKRQLVALHESPRWNLIKESGLDITEPKSMHQNLAEELYSGNLIDKNFTVGGKRVNLWTYTGGVFERLFTSMGNNMRLNLFLARAEQLENSGRTFETHPQEFKDAARVINEMTGRGKMNQVLQNANPVITPIIWAPRLISSSLNLLGVSDITLGAVKKGFYQNLTPSQRNYALKQMGRGIGVGVAIMTAAAMNGWDVDKDPKSATFGTIGKGTTRYNVFGRFSGIVKTIVQVLSGTKRTKFGEQDLDNPKYGGNTGGSVVGGFVRGKMTPFAGMLYDYKLNAGKNYFTKEPVTAQGLPDNLLTPISVSDMKKGLEQDGSWSLLTRFLPAFEGINVMDERDFKSVPPETITHNGEQIKLTDSQSKELDSLLNDTKTNYKKNLLETDEYKSATKEEKIDLERDANNLASKDAHKLFKENHADQFVEKTYEEKSEEAEKTRERNRLIRGQ